MASAVRIIYGDRPYCLWVSSQKILAELPHDIRDRLTRKASSSKQASERLGSPTLPPTESQLDPEALEALPAMSEL